MDQSNYATSVHPIRREFVQVGQCPPICLEVTCITSAAFQAGSNVFQDRSTAAGLETCFGLFSSGDFLGGFDRLGPAFPV
jgi:hypothetical protein